MAGDNQNRVVTRVKEVNNQTYHDAVGVWSHAVDTARHHRHARHATPLHHHVTWLSTETIPVISNY